MMKRFILIYFCLGFLFSSMLAQQQDSIVKAREEANALDVAMRKRSAGDTAFQVKYNALQYSMQKRYRPKGAKFANEHFFDNTFLGVWGAYNRIIPRAGVNLTGGSEVGLSLSKFFTPSTGIRLSGSWSGAKSGNDNWNSYSITADHLFNLSSAVVGYNPNRLLEVSTVSGLGYHFSTLAGRKKSAADLHLGMQLKLNTGTRLDLFAEPRLTFYTDGIDLSNQENWHKYDIGLSALVGLSYRLGTYYKYGSSIPNVESFMDNTFISAGMGMQFQNSTMIRQQGVLGSMGPIFHLAVGKWFLDPLGLRLSAFGSYNSWKRSGQGDLDYLTVYAGGRGEVMINPFAFFRNDFRDMRWGIIPMVGMEVGMMKKQDFEGLQSKGYVGLTGGVQFKYYASDNFAFYIEPRMSRVPNTFNGGKSYDNLFNASIGIELRRPTTSEWEHLATLKDGFVPYYYTQFSAGVASPQQFNRSVSRRPGFMLGAAIGRQFNALSGARLGVDVNNVSTNNTKGAVNRYSFTSFALDYMFDISNFVIGFDPDRKFGAEIFAGPVITRNFDLEKNYIGGEGGVRAYWKCFDQFDIFAEPRVRMYMHRYMPATRGAGTPLQFSLLMGTSYRFGTSFNKLLVNDFNDEGFLANTFISTSLGGQVALGGNNNISKFTSAGPVFNLSVGKWFLPFWGIRASGFAGYNAWQRVPMGEAMSDKLTSRFGGRVEAMLNVLALGNKDLREQRWALTPMLGLELGMLDKQNASSTISSVSSSYAGITAALQAKYYVTDNIGLFAESRLSRLPYSYTDGSNQRISAVDNIMNFNLGIELRRPTRAEWDKLSTSKYGFLPYYYTQFGAGITLPQHKYRADFRRPGFMLTAAIGRQFTPISGMRLGLDVSNASSYNGKTLDRYSNTSLSLDYMFDISNFVVGYNQERKFGTEVFAGPVVTKGSYLGGTNFGVEGGIRAYVNLLEQFDIFMEPKARLYSKKYVPSLGGSGTPLQFSLSMGTSYRFGSSYNKLLVNNFGDGTFLGNTFMSASVGSQYSMHSNLGINPLIAAGPVFNFSVGKWLLPFMGIRLSAFGGYNTWGRADMNQNVSVDKLSSQYGGRVEAMFNVLAIGKENARDQRWGLSPMLGLEFGRVNKQSLSSQNSSINKSYSGVTAALQAKYYVTDNIGLFIEPRFSRLPYSYTGGDGTRVSAVDNVASLNFGLEFRRSNKHDLLRLASNRDGFEPYYFVSYQMGAAMPMYTTRYTSRRLGYMVEGSIGRQFTPISAVRASLDYSSLVGIGKVNDTNRNNSLASLSLDYMFDIGNYMGGYDPERKFGVDALAGVVLSMGAEPNNKMFFGAEGGFHAYYKLPKGFDLFVEPKIRLYSKRLMYGSSATPLQMMLSMGTSYRFGTFYNKSLISNFGDGTFLGNAFMSASVGSQCLASSDLGMSPLIAAGPVFSFSVGKWLLPFMGIRLSAFGGYNTWGRVSMNQNVAVDKLSAQFGGRAEAMFNLLAIGAENVREQRWGLSPMIGIEFGALNNQSASSQISSVTKSYSGLTAALQAKYYVTDNIGLFIEPRFSRLPYSYTGGKGNRISVVDNMMSFNLGLEFRRSNKHDLKRLAANRDEFEPYYFASYQMGAAMPMYKSRYTARRLGYMVEGSIGRQFTPISAVRANLDYSSLAGIGKVTNTNRNNSFASLSLDYMFDIGNYMGGYDPERKFGVDVLVGAVVSMGAEPNNKITLGGEGGFHAYYKLPKGFEIFVEPKARLYSKNLMYGSSATPLQMMLSLGTSYKF